MLTTRKWTEWWRHFTLKTKTLDAKTKQRKSSKVYVCVWSFIEDENEKKENVKALAFVVSHGVFHIRNDVYECAFSLCLKYTEGKKKKKPIKQSLQTEKTTPIIHKVENRYSNNATYMKHTGQQL